MHKIVAIVFVLATLGFAAPASACYKAPCTEIKEFVVAKPPCKQGMHEIKLYSYDPRITQKLTDMRYVDTVCGLGKAGYGWANGPLVEASLSALYASLEALRNDKW
ncbi:MAG: hypothetical protein KBD06_02040 [Candidatus Pacebacteria bacterium]|nr:hypothetical protein [Candidatus Paceibacterota bacterium]